MTAGRCLTSPAEEEEEEEEGVVAAEKLGLSLSDGRIAEAIVLVSGYELKQRKLEFKIHIFLSNLVYLQKRPIYFDSCCI